MGLEDIVGQATDAIGGADAIDGVVDKAAEAVKEKTPDQLDSAVDAAAQAVKDRT